MLIGFEHAGMTAGDAEAAIAFYCDLLGLRLAARLPSAQGEVLFLDAGGGMLEIGCPREPQQRAVDVPKGTAGVRHLTFAFDDVDALVAKLEAAGVEITERPREARFRDFIRRVAFCRDPDGLSIELVERAEGRTA
jgi:glyoxylase I family protein